MKILQCSDLHGKLPWFEWIAREAPNYDLVCISGDLLDAGSPETTHRQIEGISRILGAVSTPLALCSGNHDLVESGRGVNAQWMRALKRPGVSLDGDWFVIGDHCFHCHGWDEAFTAPRHPDETWIVHSPPAGTAPAMERGGVDAGDYEFGNLCRNRWGPKLALCGHVHRPVEWHSRLGWTLILNPGQSDDSAEPARIVIDLKQQSATRHFPSSRPETVGLFRPTAREVLGGRSMDQIARLLQFTVSNQLVEGIRLTPGEIDETRRRLQRIASENE